MQDFKECTPLYNLFNKNLITQSFDSIPILNIGEKRGWTDYIDFINLDDMKNNSLMKGKDHFGRPFFCIKLNAKYVGSDPNLIGSNNGVVGTIFKRYTDDNYSWAYGTCYDTNMLYWDSRLRLNDYENLEARLKNLFNGKCVRNTMFRGLDKPMESKDYINGNGDWLLSLL